MSIFLITMLLTVGVMIAVGLYRVFAGPTVFDRLVAVSLLTVNSVVMIVVLGFVFDRPALFLDIALSYALLAFLFPIALARYFERRTTSAHHTPGEPPPSPGAGPIGSPDEPADSTGGRRVTEHGDATDDTTEPR